MNTVSVPLQVVFVERRDDDLVIDCLVSERIVAGPGRTIAAGTPFTIAVDSDAVVGGADAGFHLLEYWSVTGGVVEASGSMADGSIRLEAEGNELTLAMA